jgi:DNA-binding winged helix-turn-helix (wHTH) protein
MSIETQLISQPVTDASPEPGQPWAECVPPAGADGTLLAIVPIPGTQTSLAIVGYAISSAGASPHPPAAPAPAPPAPAAPVPASLLIDCARRRVQADGAEIALTFQEFELLAFLSAHPAVVFSRADLIRQVWQQPQDAADRPDIRLGTRTVDVHVSRLRRKLGPVYGQCLVTEHRAGYQFRPRPA